MQFTCSPCMRGLPSFPSPSAPSASAHALEIQIRIYIYIIIICQSVVHVPVWLCRPECCAAPLVGHPNWLRLQPELPLLRLLLLSPLDDVDGRGFAKAVLPSAPSVQKQDQGWKNARYRQTISFCLKKKSFDHFFSNLHHLPILCDLKLLQVRREPNSTHKNTTNR